MRTTEMKAECSVQQLPQTKFCLHCTLNNDRSEVTQELSVEQGGLCGAQHGLRAHGGPGVGWGVSLPPV